MAERKIFWIDAQDLCEAHPECEVWISDPAGLQVPDITHGHVALGSEDRDRHVAIHAETPNSSR